VITIIDYGASNIKSLSNAIQYLGYKFRIVNKKKELFKSDKIILPGVGAFDIAIKNLKKDKLDLAIKNHCNKGGAILGICLGMQLLGNYSFENGKNKGLSLVNGVTKRFAFKKKISIPHIGYNSITFNFKSKLFNKVEDNSFFYFSNSYHFVNEENIVSSYCNYGGPFVSSVEKKNIFGVQFHPEKSHKNGLQVLLNFINI
jgi:glutamine amidotransferase